MARKSQVLTRSGESEATLPWANLVLKLCLMLAGQACSDIIYFRWRRLIRGCMLYLQPKTSLAEDSNPKLEQQPQKNME